MPKPTGPPWIAEFADFRAKVHGKLARCVLNIFATPAGEKEATYAVLIHKWADNCTALAITDPDLRQILKSPEMFELMHDIKRSVEHGLGANPPSVYERTCKIIKHIEDGEDLTPNDRMKLKAAGRAALEALCAPGQPSVDAHAVKLLREAGVED